MNSKRGVLLGVQVPRVALVPKAVRSEADDAAFLSSAYGLTPDEWQFTVLRGWLGVRADGKWAAARCGLAVPRQNGKNGILEIVELYKMVVLGRRILHTAHEVKTARKAFVRLASFFENERQYPELAALVKEIRRTNGQEAITLTSGGSCEFVARSKGSGRGFTVDDLVCDEAQELSDDALAALLPTISSAPSRNPQLTMTGTPPSPSMVGEVWTRMRATGVEGKNRRLSWFEWSATSPVDLDDRTNWAATNPAAGIRLNWETIADERAAMDDETFARERLGMWADELRTPGLIDVAEWAALHDPKSKVAGMVALAFDVTPDRRSGSIGAAGRRKDALFHVEITGRKGVLDHRPGTSWMVSRLVELNESVQPCAIVVDGASPAAALLPDLAEAGLTVTTEPERGTGQIIVVTNATEMGRAAGGLFDAVTDSRSVRHIGQQPLDEGIEGVTERPLGDGAFGFSRKKSTSNISPVVSAALALHGLKVHGVEDELVEPWIAFG